MDKRTADLYVKLNSYKALVNRTEDFITYALQHVNSPYLACSFGKDSSVMLDLVLKKRPDIQVNFMCKTETDLIDDYKSVILWWEKNRDAHINRICYQGWLEGGKNLGISTNMPTDGFDSYFVGIRKDESAGRRISLKIHGKFFIKKNGQVRISPMADWHTDDIAAYMLSNELPILRAYKIEGFDARTTSSIPSKYPQEALSRLKDQDIESFNKLLKLLPNARDFI